MTASEQDDDCYSCGSPDAQEGECPNGERPCGHHCNHFEDGGPCHWCGAHWEGAPA